MALESSHLRHLSINDDKDRLLDDCNSQRTCRMSATSNPSQRRLVAIAGICACFAASLLLLHSRHSRGQAPLRSMVGLNTDTCVDTPDWTNGMSDCQYQVKGDDPKLCTPTGWTCAGYVAKNLCGGPEGPQGFAMGPGLNSPEKNCCACKNFKRKETCDRETGGTCRFTGQCDGWRGAAVCEGGKCVCPDGYCHGGEGSCQLDSRSAWSHRANADKEVTLTSSCSQDTGGTCVFFGQCDGYRGNVSCHMGMPPRCVCDEGHCADHGGICFRDRGVVTANVAGVSKSQPQFPAGHSHITTALCVSGGGSRSMSSALGQFRALARLGLLEKIDMISSVSGGSWASSILMFAPMDIKELLGLSRSLEPGTLTMSALEQSPPPFGAVLMNKTVSTALYKLTKRVPLRLLWVETIGECFLEPFGLNDKHAYMALSKEHAADIVRRNPQYKDATFHTVQPGRAKNIIINGCVLAPSGYKASENNAVSFQASPDFTGWPFYPNDAPVAYENSRPGKPSLDRVLTGGGLIESFAFGSVHPMKRNEQRGGQIKLIAPSTPFSLATAVGISSAAFGGQASTMLAAGENVNPQMPMWPITSPEHPRPQVSMQHMLGDGGNIENTGVLAVLQRGASKIAAMINSCDGISEDFNFCSLGAEADPTGKISGQFAQLFGYSKKASTMEFCTHNQVFASASFWPLACKLQQLKKEGKAQLVRANLTTVENAWWGIPGGKSVDIVFNLLDKAKSFESSLPPDTQSQLGSLVGPFANFPAYKTMFNTMPDMTQLTAAQINLLAAQTDWGMSQNADMLTSLYGGGAAAPTSHRSRLVDLLR